MKKLLLLLFLIPTICLAVDPRLPDDVIRSRLPYDSPHQMKYWQQELELINSRENKEWERISETRSFCAERASKAEPYMAVEIERSCLNNNNASYDLGYW